MEAYAAKIAAMNVIEWLNTTLFRLAGVEVSVLRVLVTALTLILTFILSRWIESVVHRTLAARRGEEVGSAAAVARISHHVLVIVGVMAALHFAGVNLTGLFAAGAVFAVAIGFAMQSIMQNFVSGVILLAERYITPGAILELEGQRVKLVEMGIRASIVRNRDNEDLIVPNSVLIQNTVRNFSLGGSEARVRVSVGVSYSSDIEAVSAALCRAVETVAQTEKSELYGPPDVTLSEFADSAVVFSIGCWTRQPWNIRLHRSALQFAIWNELKRDKITIAFPQLDVHVIDTPQAA